MSVEPGPSSQDPKSRPKRGAPAFCPPNRSIPELINNPANGSTIINEDTARAELEKRFFITPAAEITIESLVTTLLDFTVQAHSLSPMNVDIIRAVAILLIKTDHEQKTRLLADALIKRLTEPLERLEETAKKHDAKMEVLTRVTDKVRDSLDSATSRLADMAEQSHQATTEALKDRQTHKLQLDTTQTDNPNSYAKALQSNAVRPASSVLAKSEAQTKQILLDKRTIGEASGLTNLSEVELVNKASQALDALRKKGFNVPMNADFTSVRKLRHGGALFEVNTIETKLWIKSPLNSKAFAQEFGGNTIIKERTFQVVAEYVPTSFNPESNEALEETEKRSGLNPGAIVRAKWLKPTNRRNPGQRTAFCIIACTTREDANKTIKQGLTIEARKISTRKLLPEPTRCLKCQQLTNAHIATNCPNKDDICGTCAKIHRTSECTITSGESERQKCINCNQVGHAAWSRECPKYAERSAKLLERVEEAQYKYFPVENDPESWEILGGPHQQQPPRTFIRYEQPAAHGTEFGTQSNGTDRNQWTRVERGKGRAPRGRAPTQVGTRDNGWPPRQQRLDKWTYPIPPSQKELNRWSDDENNNDAEDTTNAPAGTPLSFPPSSSNNSHHAPSTPLHPTSPRPSTTASSIPGSFSPLQPQ